MMRISVFVLIVAMSLCATGAMAALFQNGGFELPAQAADGTYNGVVATGWTTYTNGTCNPQLLRYTPPSAVIVPEGAQYGQMQVTTINKYAGYRQTFDTIAGATYTIKGWYRPLSGTAVASVGVDTSGGIVRPATWLAQLSGATSVLWNTFSGQATATGPSMTIFLDVAIGGTNNKAAAFDGIVIPEPGSMIALLSGLVGLVGFGIRRRK